MSRYLPLLVCAFALGACSSTSSQPASNLTPADLLDMGVDMFGIVAEIPHRQYLGESTAMGANQATTVFRWQAQHTLLERGSTDVLISAERLQVAGLPVMEQGAELDFVGGLYEDVRYRLGGTLNRITVSAHYDVRVTVDWQLYDRDSGAMVYSGSSSGFGRGQNMGLTGIQPNAILEAYQDCVDNLTGQPEFAAAIGAPGMPG
jgi:hypothetical protein